MLKNLKKLRTDKGISQRTLASVLSISQQSINKYENHNIEPDIETLIRIADYFNTSVDYLIGHAQVDHKIEELHPYDLNAEELEFIDGYRKLTPKQRKSILLIIETYNEN